jgi:hypothetical protein
MTLSKKKHSKIDNLKKETLSSSLRKKEVVFCICNKKKSFLFFFTFWSVKIWVFLSSIIIIIIIIIIIVIVIVIISKRIPSLFNRPKFLFHLLKGQNYKVYRFFLDCWFSHSKNDWTKENNMYKRHRTGDSIVSRHACKWSLYSQNWLSFCLISEIWTFCIQLWEIV